MRRFRTASFSPLHLLAISLFLVLFATAFSGCEKKPVGGAEKIHWDRDMCERCKMAISERKFAAEIIDPQNGKMYKFDDIGCAILWMDEEKIPWRAKAIIWITDAKTGHWIDARTAKYTDESITPMAYGFAAYSDKTLPPGSSTLDFGQVSEKVRKIEKLNSEKLRSYK